MDTAKTACFTTLGCRLNQADTALMTGLLTAHGYRIVEPDDPAAPDLLIVNTCTVTASAAQKSRQAVRRLRKQHAAAAVIVTGCGVNVETDRWRDDPAVDLVLLPSARAELPAILRAWFDQQVRPTLPPTSFHSPETPSAHTIFTEGGTAIYPFKTRAFLKIQDGCNCFCSYCIVPYARGPQRSRDTDELMADFRALRAEGHREITLTGVNTCTFRSASGGLTDLLRRITDEPGDFRIRISSAEPHPEIRKLLGLMEERPEKICRFLHLPAQHLTERILKLMNRPYTLAAYLDYIAEARERIPDIHIGTDFIVGFPGETDDDFESASTLAQKLQFANMHLFPYSSRPGTAAAKMKQTSSGPVIRERLERLAAVAKESAETFARSMIGKPLRVLTETVADGIAEGWSDNYLRLRYPLPSGTGKGDLVTIIPTDYDSEKGTLTTIDRQSRSPAE